MKVKDVVLKAAALLGEAETVEAFIKGTNTAGKKQAELFLTCFNLVENELALDYIPLLKEEYLTAENGKIVYSDFSLDVVRIVRVRDKNGASMPFSLFADYMQVDGDGAYVTYAYTPKEKTFTGESDFTVGVSVRLMAYGVAAEYCMAMGLYEESAHWDKKYKEGIEGARSVERKKMPSRRWV